MPTMGGLQTATEIIDALGGNTVVARRIGKTPSAVSEMKRRGSIPVRYWSEIASLAGERGLKEITVQKLADLHAQMERA
jgi:hypothetical protein